MPFSKGKWSECAFVFSLRNMGKSKKSKCQMLRRRAKPDGAGLLCVFCYLGGDNMKEIISWLIIIVALAAFAITHAREKTHEFPALISLKMIDD